MYLEVTSYELVRALAFNLRIHGWTVQKVDPGSADATVIHTDAIIGTTPRGVHVRFDSVRHAAEVLKCNAEGIRTAIYGTNHKYGSWSWSMDSGKIKTVNPSDKACSSFNLRDGVGGKQGKKKTHLNDTSATVRTHKEPEVIATGYHDEDFGVTICPFCANVITRDGQHHLARHLAGHRYTITHGLIKVYK